MSLSVICLVVAALCVGVAVAALMQGRPELMAINLGLAGANVFFARVNWRHSR